MGGGDLMAEPRGCNAVGAITFFWGLIGGTGTSLCIKILYQLTAENSEGQISHFEKPMFLTAIMFIAMMSALPLFFFTQLCRRKEDREEVPIKVLGWLIVPSIFDLAGTNLAQIGLVYTTVSYFQLLRCTVIIVTAFLKAFVLKHRLQTYMWWGVAINILAMVLVSLTSFLTPADAAPSEDGGSNNPAIGSFFILLSCVVQGSQYIFEEKVMAVDNAPPLVVIGMEGFWGTVIMIFLFPLLYYIPGGDAGSIENLGDTFVMVSNSTMIQTMLFVFFIFVLMYNSLCIYVTAYLSAIWHAILDNCRPSLVWAVDLIMFYYITDGIIGEPWTEYSWLQAVGMFILFFGTAVYNGSIQLPFLEYSSLYQQLGTKSPGMTTPLNLASTSMTQSPLLTRAAVEYASPNLAAQLKARQYAQEYGVVADNEEKMHFHPPLKASMLGEKRQSYT